MEGMTMAVILDENKSVGPAGIVAPAAHDGSARRLMQGGSVAAMRPRLYFPKTSNFILVPSDGTVFLRESVVIAPFSFGFAGLTLPGIYPMSSILRTLLFALLVSAPATARAQSWRGTLVTASPEHPRNDSATVVELRDGRLLMVWMEFVKNARAGSDEAPNHLVSMISSDRGRTWGSREVLVEPGPGEVNVYNPSLLMLKNGEIFLTYIAYNLLEWKKPLLTSGFGITISTDAKHHSAARRLWDHQPYQTANNTLTRLRSGRIIRATDKCEVWGGVSASGCQMSDDDGITWKPSSNWVMLPLRGTMEAHIAETNAGDLLMAVRNDLGAVFFSRSADEGMSWSPPQTSGLSAPEAMPVLTRLSGSGDLLLVWNHSQYWGDYNHYGLRTPLTCAISHDSGVSWGSLRDLETDPDTEFSNPSCNLLSGSEVIITYFSSTMIDKKKGRFGRSKMDLKAFIASEEWFSREDAK
jgi:sialidase-1